MSDELATVPLAVEVAPGHLESNLADFKKRCSDLAAVYSNLGEIEGWDDYQQAKRDRAALNNTVKQANDARIEVKRTFMEPLDDFTAEVNEALAPLKEAQERQSKQVSDYEQRLRDAKRERLEAYWEESYPLLALNTGEAEEPLVPFDRVFDPDWTKRISEVGRDDEAREAMDSIADDLARGRDMISSLEEPEDIRLDALSRMYRMLDPVEAVTWAHEEARRKRDISGVERCVANIAEPGYGDHVEQPDPAMHVYRITIECIGEAEMMRVKQVMRDNGINGTIRRM